jgi:hypothetical protein
MSDYQCPKCKSGNISKEDTRIRCFSCGFFENLEDYPIARPAPVIYALPEQLQSLEDRVQNVEELVATPGSVPYQFRHQLQQIKGELAYLRTNAKPIKPPKKQKAGFKEIEV